MLLCILSCSSNLLEHLQSKTSVSGSMSTFRRKGLPRDLRPYLVMVSFVYSDISEMCVCLLCHTSDMAPKGLKAVAFKVSC